MQCQPWVFHNVLLILWRNISCILVYSHGIHEQLFKTREWPRAGVWLVRASGRSLYLIHFLCHNFPRWFSLAVLQLLGDSLTIKLPPPKMSLSSVTLKMHLSYFPEAKIRGKCAFATRLKLKKEKKKEKLISFFLLDPSWRTTTLTWKLLWAMVIWASLLTFRHQRLETLDFSQATRTAQWFFRWECRNIEKTKCRVKYHLRLIITLMFGLTISLAISWVVSIALLTGVCRLQASKMLNICFNWISLKIKNC